MIFEKVTKSYGQTVVLRELTLQLPQKGIIGFYGPSGCGKTTIFNLIAGTITPDAGKIDSFGNVSYVFQEDRLLLWLSVLENIEIVSSGKGKVCLEKVKLSGSEKKYPDELSGGQKRRVALARGLAFDAPVLLLDEPFNGIDEETKKSIYPLIKERAQKSLVLISTHDQEDFSRLCDQVYLLSGPPVVIKEVLSQENIRKKFYE